MATLPLRQRPDWAWPVRFVVLGRLLPAAHVVVGVAVGVYRLLAAVQVPPPVTADLRQVLFRTTALSQDLSLAPS